MAAPGVVVTGGSTLDNAENLSPAFVSAVQQDYGGTLLGRQEIDGELILDVVGGLWSRAMIEACRSTSPPAAIDARFDRVVIGVDPPASSGGDACGILVCASMSEPLWLDGFENAARFAVIEDATIEKASPARWARAVAEAAMRWGADRIVAEANNGGEMIRRVIDAEAIDLPVVLAHARGSKAARAEPVALAYARGRVTHAGVFARLEDELCGLMAGGGYVGPGRSPDRADALVWALSELIAADRQSGPRVRGL